MAQRKIDSSAITELRKSQQHVNKGIQLFLLDMAKALVSQFALNLGANKRDSDMSLRLLVIYNHPIN